MFDDRDHMNLADTRLYLCTDARRERGDFADFVDAAYAGGVDVVQLRDKTIEAGRELELLATLAAVAARHGKAFAVNDRADIAALAGSPILHLGQGDLPVARARTLVADGARVGLSTHTPAQVDAVLGAGGPAGADGPAGVDGSVNADGTAARPGGVAQAGAPARRSRPDYFCTGPLWATPTKPGRAAVGLDLVRYAARRQAELGDDTPWFAIGGIDESTIGRVVDAGARRVVVVRAITEASDPADAAARLLTAFPR